MMRIRLSFAAAFVCLLFIASAGGLLPHSVLPNTPASPVPQTDKFLHFIIFFAVTATFYFALDTSRRRILHLTLFVCTFALGVGSEVVQGLLPNGRDFDPLDVIANVTGSLCALGLASIYHKRSLERRRKARYPTMAGHGLLGDEDLELGESSVEHGSSHDDARQDRQTNAISPVPKTVDEELDNWDENAVDDVLEADDTLGGSTSAIENVPATKSVESSDVTKKVMTK